VSAEDNEKGRPEGIKGKVYKDRSKSAQVRRDVLVLVMEVGSVSVSGGPFGRCRPIEIR
jgi:hypothetical protein